MKSFLIVVIINFLVGCASMIEKTKTKDTVADSILRQTSQACSRVNTITLSVGDIHVEANCK